MRGARKLALGLALAVLLAAALGACGGDGSDGSTATNGREATAPTTTAGSSDGNSSAGDGSGAFRTPGGDNSIQNFGEEADPTEIAAATAVLAAYLQARTENDWDKQCAYLAKAAVAPLEQLAARTPRFKGKGCAAILAALMSGAPASTRANTLRGDVASLRVEDERGFALYHGAGGVDYFVPLVEEDGQWKLVALAPSEFP